jgi:hypothetical protein
MEVSNYDASVNSVPHIWYTDVKNGTVNRKLTNAP